MCLTVAVVHVQQCVGVHVVYNGSTVTSLLSMQHLHGDRRENRNSGKRKQVYKEMDRNTFMDADLAEEPRVQARQLRGHVLLVHVVELVERRSGRETALHQVQYRHHP